MQVNGSSFSVFFESLTRGQENGLLKKHPLQLY